MLINFILSIFPFIVISLFLLAFLFIILCPNTTKYKIDNLNSLYWFILLLLCSICILSTFQNYNLIGFQSILIYSCHININVLSIVLTLINQIILFFILFISSIYNIRLYIEEFCLLSISFYAITFIFHFENLLSLFISLELINLIFYILASLSKNNSNASLKYSLLTIVSTNLFLISLFSLYTHFGSLNLIELNLLIFYSNNFCLDNLLIEISFFLMICSLSPKSGCAPFHQWLIDIYVNSSNFAFFLSIIYNKLFVVTLIIKLFNKIILSSLELNFIFISSLACFIVGLCSTIFYDNIKLSLSFSGLIPIGYFPLSFSCSNNLILLTGFFYSVSYCFLVIISLTHFSTFKNFFFFKSINYIKGFFNIEPLIGLSLVFRLMSFIGIPPFIGFVMKIYLVSSFHLMNFNILCFIVILVSSLACIHHLKLIILIFKEIPLSESEYYKEIFVFIYRGKYNSYLLIFFFILNSFLFLFYEIFIREFTFLAYAI